MIGAGASRMTRHVHICRQVAGDDRIQEHEHKQRQPEEQADDGEEERFCPWWINICATFRIIRIINIIGNCQHWRSENY